MVEQTTSSKIDTYQALREKLSDLMEGKSLTVWGIWFFSWAVISLILFSPYFSKGLNLEINDISQVQVVSPRDYLVQTSSDKEETKRLRDEKEQEVEDVYTIDPEVQKKVKENIREFFKLFKSFRRKDAGVTLRDLTSYFPLSQLKQLNRVDDTTLVLLENIIIYISEVVLENGVREVDDATTLDLIQQEVQKINIDNEYKRLITSVIRKFLIPNLLYDEYKTKKKQAEARESVKSLMTVYKKGQPILYVGDVVTEDHYMVLKSLGFIGVKANIDKIVSISCLTLLLILLLYRFMVNFKPHLAYDLKIVLLLNLLVLTAVIATKLFSLMPSVNVTYWVSVNLIPYAKYISLLPLFVMLTAILIDKGVAFVAGSVIAVIAGLIFSSVEVVVYNFIITAFAVFNVVGVYERKDLTRAGIAIGTASMVSLLFMYILFIPQIQPKDLLFVMLWGFGLSILSAVITIGILPYFESMFGISTPMQYLELSNPNHPLLRRLMIEAPGTYHHSSIVASLAEAATESIGGDYLLARVGAFFHDIGKLKRPYFFVENQVYGDNPHSKLAPRLSALIILSHTKDGVDLAKKYRLPQDIIRIIERHHGDSLVYYFYQKYLQKENVDVVQEDQFRYPGPKPERKETAIIMLADSVEAAVRSMEKPNLNKIENIIKRIIREKLDDGQLSNAYLSLAELEIIKRSFIKTLVGTYHARIDYSPEKIAKELDSKKEVVAKS